MAAATVTQRRQNDVFGRLRRVSAGSIAFANNGDTWQVPGIKQIYGLDLTPTTGTVFGFTISGNTVTLIAAGGLTFMGGALGL